jgi:hypothetical protein
MRGLRIVRDVEDDLRRPGSLEARRELDLGEAAADLLHAIGSASASSAQSAAEALRSCIAPRSAG